MDKWTRKYLLLARTLAHDNDACYSRRIGCVLVSENNRIMSLGYNGTVEGAPHPDTAEYLDHLYETLLTDADKASIATQYGVSTQRDFVVKFTGCKQCPRRILGIQSGQRLDLCPCAHAERNALASANQLGVSTVGSTLYCYCGVPCHECTLQIVQAKVSRVVCLIKDSDYSPSSRGLLRMSNVALDFVDEKDLEKPNVSD